MQQASERTRRLADNVRSPPHSANRHRGSIGYSLGGAAVTIGDAVGAVHHKRRVGVHRGEQTTPKEEISSKGTDAITDEEFEAWFKVEAARVSDRVRAERSEGVGNRRSFGASSTKTISGDARDRLVKALGMLGSDHNGEILSAARVVESQRKTLGVTWDELIVAGELRSDLAA